MTPATPATAGVSSSSSNPSDSVQTLDVDSLKNSEEMRAAFRQLSKEEVSQIVQNCFLSICCSTPSSRNGWTQNWRASCLGKCT